MNYNYQIDWRSLNSGREIIKRRKVYEGSYKAGKEGI